jgi:hypothetical protein
VADPGSFPKAEVESRRRNMMRKLSKITILVMVVAGVLALVAAPALAVSRAHFVGTPTATRNDSTLTISGKVAGLGDVEEITVTITGDVACINPGSKHPKAANKEALTGGATVPVQNGKADFSVTTDVPDIAPSCSPPMTLQFSNVTVTVTAADGTFLQYKFPGTF